jgi:hypothetical protein
MPFLPTRQWLNLLPKSVTVLIDLDSSTMYGNDYNDLVWILQLMHHSRREILSVMRKLLNPAMAAAVRRIESHGHSVRACVYTRKSGMVEHLSYSSRFRVGNGDIYFPASSKLREVLHHSDAQYHSFERLFFARQMIGEALGRTDIEMVLTNSHKSVAATCTSTLVPQADPGNAILYDDNTDYEDATIVPLFETISHANAQAILDIVGREPVDARLVKIIRNGMDEFYCSLDAADCVSIAASDDPVSDWPVPFAYNAVSLKQHAEATTRGYVVAWRKFW